MWQQFADPTFVLSRQARQDILQIGKGIRLMTVAARLPARRLPANSQFFRPVAIGQIRFSIQLLSIGT